MAKSGKKKLRAGWLQVHKWIGLLLAVLIIPISLTGSALVWHDWLDETLNPGAEQRFLRDPAYRPRNLGEFLARDEYEEAANRGEGTGFLKFFAQFLERRVAAGELKLDAGESAWERAADLIAAVARAAEGIDDFGGNV